MSDDREIVFYDGNCGLCHASVRFLLRHDSRDRFCFAPLGGLTFAARIPPERRASLPDSLVLMRQDGALLIRSDGALHALRGLGGPWPLLARVAAVVPRPLRDRLYDGVARIRHRLFARPTDACPLVPQRSRDRFLP